MEIVCLSRVNELFNCRMLRDSWHGNKRMENASEHRNFSKLILIEVELHKTESLHFYNRISNQNTRRRIWIEHSTCSASTFNAVREPSPKRLAKAHTKSSRDLDRIVIICEIIRSLMRRADYTHMLAFNSSALVCYRAFINVSSSRSRAWRMSNIFPLKRLWVEKPLKLIERLGHMRKLSLNLKNIFIKWLNSINALAN